MFELRLGVGFECRLKPIECTVLTGVNGWDQPLEGFEYTVDIARVDGEEIGAKWLRFEHPD